MGEEKKVFGFLILAVIYNPFIFFILSKNIWVLIHIISGFFYLSFYRPSKKESIYSSGWPQKNW